MRRSSLVLCTALAVLAGAAPAALANPSPPALDTAQATGNNFIVDTFSSYAIEIDAFSDPDGANPGGTVSFQAGALRAPVSGTVNCLRVDGNVATISLAGPPFGFPGALGIIVRLTDNGGGGLDRFDFYPVLPEFGQPVDCVTGAPGYFGGLLNGRAIVVDSSGACSASNAARCPDSLAPETTITKGPANRIERRRAWFGFRSDEAGSSFECATDRGPYAPCSSPHKVRRLAPGWHLFEVRATDSAGNVDASPARDRFKVLRSARRPAAGYSAGDARGER